MHRVILGNLNYTDHINRNTLDNRKENLRDCTCSQNGANSKIRVDSTSGFKGVDFVKSHNRWRARIKPNQIEYNLGEYIDINEAAQAYNIAALRFFGEFSNLNDVQEPSINLVNKVNKKIDSKIERDSR